MTRQQNDLGMLGTYATAQTKLKTLQIDETRKNLTS